MMKLLRQVIMFERVLEKEEHVWVNGKESQGREKSIREEKVLNMMAGFRGFSGRESTGLKQMQI